MRFCWCAGLRRDDMASMPHGSLMKHEFETLRRILFDGSEAGGSSPSTSEFLQSWRKKPLTLQNTNKYYKIHACIGLLLQKARGGSMAIGWHHPMVEIDQKN